MKLVSLQQGQYPSPRAVYAQSVMLSPRFTPKSVFYTQSVVCSLQSAVRSPQCVFYTDRVNRHQPCLFQWYARRRAFSTKTRTIILFTNMTLNRLGFGVTATGHFHFENNETEDMLVYQGKPVGVELISFVDNFVGFTLHSLCTEI